MNNYLCRICDVKFDRPFVTESGAWVCPVCLSPYYRYLDVSPCSTCGGDKPEGDVLCKECGRQLVHRFRERLLPDFGDLTDDENEYLTTRICEYGLNDILEGTE